MKHPMLIGITGYAESGKDSVAGFLAEYGYTRYAFADALKALAREIGWDETKRMPADYNAATDEPEVFWPGALNGRLLLQRLGQGARSILGDDVWIHALNKTLCANEVLDDVYSAVKPCVVSDIRFPNEADWVHDLGGVVLRVYRAGYVNTVGLDHESESSIDKIDHDYSIAAESLDNLRRKTVEWIKGFDEPGLTELKEVYD